MLDSTKMEKVNWAFEWDRGKIDTWTLVLAIYIGRYSTHYFSHLSIFFSLYKSVVADKALSIYYLSIYLGFRFWQACYEMSVYNS